jgi:hypothetical protein
LLLLLKNEALSRKATALPLDVEDADGDAISGFALEVRRARLREASCRSMSATR